MIVERPDERQWQDMVRTYGPPTFSDRAMSIAPHPEESEAHGGLGAVILLIFNLAGSCIFVRKGPADWFYPTGRIGAGEGIAEAARRVARAVTGVEIEPVGAPSCQRVMLSFKDRTIQRWHIVVVAETASSVMTADMSSAPEVMLSDIPPVVVDNEKISWINELHHIGTKYLRTLDALDGI